MGSQHSGAGILRRPRLAVGIEWLGSTNKRPTDPEVETKLKNEESGDRRSHASQHTRESAE